MRLTWLRFRREFASDWLSFQNESTHSQTLLGRCLPRLGEFMPFGLKLFANNTQSLGGCYNAALDEANEGDALVFVHDDVRIDDWMLGQRLQDALAVFDVVGVAGNRRRQAGQLTWYLQPPAPDRNGQMHAPWDKAQLSGAIWHSHTCLLYTSDAADD